MFIIWKLIQRSWICDERVLDGLQILHFVQVEVFGIIFTHVCCGWISLGFEQGSVCPDARFSILASDSSWSAWVAVTILICEFVLSASWVIALGSISRGLLV
jgi:hypothetical protein